MRMQALAILMLGVSAVSAQPFEATAAELAAHRALYDLKLESARGDVAAASGTMAYEVLDACDGWAVQQRLRMTVTNRDGQDIQMLSDYSTWESKDGTRLRFRMKQTTDEAVTSEVSGDATLDHSGGTGTVHYSIPAEVTKDLPAGTLFPMAHTGAVLAAAQAGKKFVTIPLFDGTGPDGAQDSTVVVAEWNPPGKSTRPALADLPSARVRIAFFDRTATAQTPDYEVSMRYWSNGIADDLSMDFGDFVMSGKLKDLMLPKPGC